MLPMTLERVAVERPNTEIEHLCLDKGYDNPKGHEAVAAHSWGGLKHCPQQETLVVQLGKSDH